MSKPRKQGLIAFDQWINAAFFNGWADETLSARAWRNSMQFNVKWRRIQRYIDQLFFWQKNHCHFSYVSEQKRLQLPPAYRQSIQEE